MIPDELKRAKPLTGKERLGAMRDSEYMGAEDIDPGSEPILTIDHRRAIEEGISESTSARKIARSIGVSASTVTREVRANRTVRVPDRKGDKASAGCAKRGTCERRGTACEGCGSTMRCKDCLKWCKSQGQIIDSLAHPRDSDGGVGSPDGTLTRPWQNLGGLAPRRMPAQREPNPTDASSHGTRRRHTALDPAPL